MRRIEELALILGTGITVTIEPSGQTWIGFANHQLCFRRERFTTVRPGGPVMFGKDFEEALSAFTTFIRGAYLSWPNHNLDDGDTEVRVPTDLAVS